ncbi:R3H and coiled-coil domain-containing protein 1-like [Daphnia pulicaria]|uniref:R3H and coiled-coil domain-containing protein 1-like n=1 Tax=Daphnia pulicaria TaxID=35523 RepID=UPI001EEA0660|nr:R3H and coiled-coil domain-containing protein 1-like [Daphnia pulicaria]
MTHSVAPFASLFKAANDILPCSTFLNQIEESFVEQVYADICAFAVTPQPLGHKAVYLFPSVSPRLRFLIHQVVEINFSSLKTFSIGKADRRTVVCPKVIYKMDPTQEKSPKNDNCQQPQSTDNKQPRKQRAVNERAIYRPPPARSSGVLQETIKQNVDPVPVSAQSPSCNLKKPSQAIYVPPQRKSSMQNHNLSDDWKESEKIKPRVESGTKVISPIRKKSIRVEMRLAVEEETNQTPTFKKEESNSIQAPPQISRKISRTSSTPFVQPSEQSILDVGDLMECCEFAELSNHVPLEKPASPKESNLQRNISFEEDSWDKLYNETGDLLRPDALEELTLAVGSVRIIQPSNEVYSQASHEAHDEDLNHVIELYDFPSTFKTEDLFTALNVSGKPPDFSLKWVDDTHALAIYGSAYAAVDALAATQSLIKMRPLAQATKESRNCARRISTALQPFKPRPVTSASMAKRLVSTALGIRNTVSPEQRKIERQMLADAKAKKRLAAQQKEAAWEGTMP